MGALAWLLFPLIAGICAGLWGSWASRTRKVRADGPELDGYARFRAAMERSAVTGRPTVTDRPAAPADATTRETSHSGT